MTSSRHGWRAALLTAGLLLGGIAAAQEAAIRKNLGERLPQMGQPAPIDEVTRTPMPGLYEVRIGTEVYYTDAEGNYLLHGELLDMRKQRNLTEERMARLLAIDFDRLPLKDAFTIVRGNGKRRVALFQDPNCTYCKRFERELQRVDNVTIHMFLYPILGPDSLVKSRNVWCARDKGRAWQDWMVRDIVVPPAPAPGCDTTALDRNREFGRKYQITGTPTLVFADGKRISGAIAAADFEKRLAEAQ
ncbi:MAG TPA: DsbC family protein [Ramlibacter sp.]|jgi:thiol:disulfide interchange protein DsbC|uniref:DsbC family protein n=1 Tax=Ramlibacter sp. TaxID=1917967 RepID=UPI002D23EDAF|nr:DsbC family protein [Ramlibacter sp.]HZY19819.1 DsbC family protein [Ramlibacter sp.]